jgi:hypothetical protein
MGGGESKYVQDQERFVRNNLELYRKVVPDRYSRGQIQGKLRQLYASSDTAQRNKDTYINDYTWNDIKKKVNPVYATAAEYRGERRYH